MTSALSLAFISLILCALLYANVAAEDQMSGRAATGILFADLAFASATINLLFIMILMFDQARLVSSARVVRGIASSTAVFFAFLLATDVSAMQVANAAYGRGFIAYYGFFAAPIGGLVGLALGRRVNRSLRRHNGRVSFGCCAISSACILGYFLAAIQDSTYTLPLAVSVGILSIAAAAAGVLVGFLRATR